MEIKTLGDVSNWFYRKSMTADPDGEFYKMAHITGRAGMRLAFLEFVFSSLTEEEQTDFKLKFAERVIGAWDET